MHAVVGGDGDAGAERMAATDLETIVLHHVESIREGIHGGVAEAWVVVPGEGGLVERYGWGEKHRELSADDAARMPLGGGVAGQRDAVAVQADLDAFDLIRREVVFAAHRDQRVQRGMGIAAARIGLYADPHGFVDLTKSGDGLFGMGVVAVADQQAMGALDRSGRTDEIAARQGRCDYAVHRGGADLVALVPGPVDEKLQRACGLAAGDAEGGDDLRRRQPEHFPPRPARAKTAPRPARIKAAP